MVYMKADCLSRFGYVLGIICISTIHGNSRSVFNNQHNRHIISQYNENIQDILGSKALSPVAQRDKLKSKSKSWHCDTCRDTNSYKRIDRIKQWTITMSLDDDIDTFEGKGSLSEPNPEMIHKDCVQYGTVEKAHDFGMYLIISIIPTQAIFSIFWFLVGVVTTLFSHFLVMRYMAYMKRYIDDFVEKLEQQCLSDYRNGLYVEVIQTLAKNIPYVINYRGAQHLDTASFQHLLAKAYLSLNNIAAAESLLLAVKVIYEPLGRDYHLANVLEDIGTVNYANDNYEDALDYYITALDVHVELLAGTPAEMCFSSPSLQKSYGMESPQSTSSSSLKYEEKYRRHLVQKALSEAKSSMAKSTRSRSNSKPISPTTSASFESPVATTAKSQQQQQQKMQARSLNDAFELELDSDSSVRELENLLSSPECVEVSPLSTNMIPDSPENVIAESYPIGSEIPASPDTIRLHHLVGKVLCSQERYPTAMEYFNIALEMLKLTDGSSESIDEIKREMESVSQLLKFSMSVTRTASFRHDL